MLLIWAITVTQGKCYSYICVSSQERAGPYPQLVQKHDVCFLFPRSNHVYISYTCASGCVHTQSRPAFCSCMDCSPSSVPGTLQARMPEWVAISSSRGSSRPRIKPTSAVSPALAGGLFTAEPPGAAITYAYRHICTVHVHVEDRSLSLLIVFYKLCSLLVFRVDSVFL